MKKVTAVLLVFWPAVAAAQTDPKFTYGKAEEVKAVEWKTQAKAGALLTSGNSQARSGTMSLLTSRKAGSNKLSLEGNLAYGKTNVLTPVVDTTTMPATITDLERRPVTSTNNWLAKGRYDRFFTENSSAYGSAQAAADRIAGKTFFGGAQVGYSRQLIKDDMNLVVAEIGYDFSYERYVQQPAKTIDPVTVHSARVFVGETLKVSPDTGVTASVEALFNVNKEGKALNASNGMVGVDPFKDTRVLGKVGLSTTLVKSLSMAFGFTVKYDQNPAPRPIPAGAPAGAVYAPGFQPFAQPVDTMTEATLIYTFL